MLAQPILAVLFQRGAFGAGRDRGDRRRRSPPTPPACPPLSWSRCWRPAFSRASNTATPVKIAVLCDGDQPRADPRADAVLLAHVGIALALVAAGWVQALTLLVLLRAARPFPRSTGGRARKLPRIAAAALGMAAMLCGLLPIGSGAGAGRPAVLQLGALVGLIAAGLRSFRRARLALGVAELARLRAAPATGLTPPAERR